MKKYWTIGLLIVVLLTSWLLNSDISNVAAQVLDIEQAKREVRNFAGDGSLEIKLALIENPQQGLEYVFENEKNDLYHYNVQQKRVTDVYYNFTFPNMEQKINISKAEALSKAENFVIEKYKSFRENNMKLIYEQLDDHGQYFKKYNFIWRQENNGILTPNYVSVAVMPNTGQIISFNSRNIELTVPTIIPTIDEEEAINLTRKLFSFEITEVEAVLDIWVNPNIHKDFLRWTVRVEGAENQHRIIMLDAMTGEEVTF
jgi:hypothetical protein